MAGTLTISTLSDGTNSTSSTNCIQGSAKAWVNFNGTGTPAIRASYNVASITKVATGSYTVNLSSAMPDTNYSIIGSARIAGNAGSLLPLPDATLTASNFRVETRPIPNAAAEDAAYVYVANFR